MSAMALDQSLDTLIASKKKERRSSRKSTGSNAGGANRKKVSSVTKAAKKGKSAIVGTPVVSLPVTLPAAAVGGTAHKINVSNLPPDVKEAEIKDLFTTTVGPLKSVNLHFDAQGKSKGMATVVFSKRGDAEKALAQYHNRLIDGSRKMKIEIVLDAGRAIAGPPTLTQRVGPAPASTTTPKTKTVIAGTQKVANRRKRVVGRAKKTPRAPVTAADLDAQMEDYSNAGVTTA